MKMFYGYKRAPKDAPADCEKVWLDDAKTGRQERGDMMLSLSDGDIVVVLAQSDLGRGAEVKAIVAGIEAAGASLSVGPPEVIPAQRGRPPMFAPDPEQDRKIRALYHSYNVMSYVLDRASAIMGWPVQAHHLKRRYGNRWPNSRQEPGQ
jgi:hypothetical protein